MELKLKWVKGIKEKPYHAKCTVCPGKEIKIGDHHQDEDQLIEDLNMILIIH